MVISVSTPASGDRFQPLSAPSLEVRVVSVSGQQKVYSIADQIGNRPVLDLADELQTLVSVLGDAHVELRHICSHGLATSSLGSGGCRTVTLS